MKNIRFQKIIPHINPPKFPPKTLKLFNEIQGNFDLQCKFIIIIKL